MGIIVIKSLIQGIFGSPRPVRRTKRNSVRVILENRKITLESELMKDELGYFLDIAIPSNCYWEEPAAALVTNHEKAEISALITRELPKVDKIRAVVKIY